MIWKAFRWSRTTNDGSKCEEFCILSVSDLKHYGTPLLHGFLENIDFSIALKKNDATGSRERPKNMN